VAEGEYIIVQENPIAESLDKRGIHEYNVPEGAIYDNEPSDDS
jgi:hypothetical protein